MLRKGKTDFLLFSFLENNTLKGVTKGGSASGTRGVTRTGGRGGRHLVTLSKQKLFFLMSLSLTTRLVFLCRAKKFIY